MAVERVIKAFESVDGRARLSIIARDDGHYRFEGEVETEEDMVFWESDGESGLYESAEAAEQDARRTVSWLRDQSPG